MKKYIQIYILLSFCYTSSFSQPLIKYSAADIQLALNKLNVLGSVLYIAAHPDDENQRTLAYMAQKKLYHTAYLALTRGDGGQNLIGSEKGDLLGVIRTHELLGARYIDGAKQYFTRAIDFGYSKSAEETLRKWDRQLILGDVVSVIRHHRPDIIITRFTESRGGHGHHLSSAILAKEAFNISSDPNQFPEQLEKIKPWQPKRLFWNSWRPDLSSISELNLLSTNAGEYNPLLGLSYQELAAKARSMHKTQGFGATPYRGESYEYYDLISGDSAASDLFEGIETSWKRVDNSDGIQISVNELVNNFNPLLPHKSVSGLLNLYKLLNKHEENYWIEIKKQEIKNLLLMISGLWLDATALKESAAPGDEINIRTTVLNRSDTDVTLQKIRIQSFKEDSTFFTRLKNNQPQSVLFTHKIPENKEYSQPFWLKKPASETMFDLPKNYDGSPVAEADLHAYVTLKFADLSFEYKIPVVYRWNDPTKGEQYKPFYILPAVSLSLDQNTYIFADDKSRSIIISAKAISKNAKGKIGINLPDGWTIEPKFHSFSFQTKDEIASFKFSVFPTKNARDGLVRPFAQIGSKKLTHQVINIDYDHIPQQNILQPAEAPLIKLDIDVPKKRIAYIMGSGDEIPQSLSQIGMTVDLLSDDDLQTINYSQYDAVIAGVRAFNTRENLALLQARIIEYVKQGGTWIVQHNTRFGKQVKQIGPYPITQSRQRISEEDAQIDILDPDHKLFNHPNKITKKDFKGWVQERSVYMPSAWEGKLYPLLAGADKGEPARLGGILYGPYGKGVFIYTSMAWFRQLPAGVPGAYRIFVNMICAGDK